MPRSADIKRAWPDSLRILPSAPVPTARGRLKERRKTRGGWGGGRGGRGKEKRKRRRWKSVGGCGWSETNWSFFPSFFFRFFSPLPLPLLSFFLFSFSFFFSFTSSLFSTSILSRSTIFLRGLKNLSGSRGNMAHATGCNAIKIHEAWKTRLARDFARLCSWITALSRVLRDLCSERGYQNNWIPREFVIYKQPLNVSISFLSLSLSLYR